MTRGPRIAVSTLEVQTAQPDPRHMLCKYCAHSSVCRAREGERAWGWFHKSRLQWAMVVNYPAKDVSLDFLSTPKSSFPTCCRDMIAQCHIRQNTNKSPICTRWLLHPQGGSTPPTCWLRTEDKRVATCNLPARVRRADLLSTDQ